MIKTLNTLVLALSLSFSVHASTVFDFTTPYVDFGPSISRSEDGIDLTVRGGLFDDNGDVINDPFARAVGTFSNGLAVYNPFFDWNPQIDGMNGNDLAIFEFSEEVYFESITFYELNIGEQFTFFVDVLNDGTLDVQGFSYDPAADVYNFNPASLSEAFGVGALRDGDSFFIKSITVSGVSGPSGTSGGTGGVSSVPLPAALPLFGIGLIGLGFLGRLKSKIVAAV